VTSRGLIRTAALSAAIALGFGASGALGACGGSPKLVVHAVKPLSVPSLPNQVLGLTLKPESADQFKEAKRPYIDAVAIYSLRQGDTLEATLQISRFDSTARLKEPKFRDSLVGQIGSTTPKQVRVGSDPVWLTTGTRQAVSVWFRGRYMFILSSREDFTQPRSLLRSLLAVQP
jgi:hypothetical protein